MPRARKLDIANPWKVLSITLIAAVVSALVGGVVVANYRSAEEAPQEQPRAAARQRSNVSSHQAGDAPVPAAPAPVARRPSAADIERCNSEASDVKSRAEEAFKSAVIGSAIGAGVGAAGGAIADGGGGAGKGAGIGALVGAAAGTVYGINSTNSNSADAQRIYRQCMARNGF